MFDPSIVAYSLTIIFICLREIAPAKFNLRISPDLHAKLSIAAQLQGEALITI